MTDVPARRSETVTLVLALGVASLVFSWCWCVGPVLSIVALSRVGRARQEIAASGDPGSSRMLTVGITLNWLGLALFVTSIGWQLSRMAADGNLEINLG